jgi:hypothetical protein
VREFGDEAALGEVLAVVALLAVMRTLLVIAVVPEAGVGWKVNCRATVLTGGEPE